MPTNVLRQRTLRARGPAGRPVRQAAGEGGVRSVLIRAGRVTIRARLLDTPTAGRIWQALPLFSTVERWGEEVFFETVVESGRERGARTIVAPGEVAFAPDRGAIVIAFGRTPASKQGEVRLWSPSNVWAEALDDVTALAAVRPGEKVEVVRAACPEPPASP